MHLGKSYPEKNFLGWLFSQVVFVQMLLLGGFFLQCIFPGGYLFWWLFSQYCNILEILCKIWKKRINIEIAGNLNNPPRGDL